MTMELDCKCPSWNDMYAGQHWSKRKKLAEEIHELVYFSILKEGKNFKETFDSCNIFFDIYFKGKRRRDPDNCNVKLFIDGLVMAGVIEDDNSDIIQEIAIRCRTGAEKDKIIIIIDATEL